MFWYSFNVAITIMCDRELSLSIFFVLVMVVSCVFVNGVLGNGLSPDSTRPLLITNADVLSTRKRETYLNGILLKKNTEKNVIITH